MKKNIVLFSLLLLFCGASFGQIVYTMSFNGSGKYEVYATLTQDFPATNAGILSQYSFVFGTVDTDARTEGRRRLALFLSAVAGETIHTVTEPKGLLDMYVLVNDQKVFFRTTPQGGATSLDFSTEFPLKVGNNTVLVVARSKDRSSSTGRASPVCCSSRRRRRRRRSAAVSIAGRRRGVGEPGAGVELAVGGDHPGAAFALGLGCARQ